MTRSSSLLAGGEDTIVAIATAEGRGALATIRLSGPRAHDIALQLGASTLAPRVATRVLLQHPHDGSSLDDALVTAFHAPHSYTGEHVVELSTHGGRVAPRLVLAACLAAGARVALPGEFTRRAVLNGRLDLLQAEAVAELIDARTTAMHQQALHQLDGALTRTFAELRDRLVHVEALIAYDIDFPEEDDGPIPAERIDAALTEAECSIDALLATAPRASMLRDGALVVIAGPPNAGKSSLFNALLGQSRALVTPIAGTTRDAIEAVLDTPRVPLRLVDTAGLRDTDDTIEQLGIEVSERYLSSAQVVLACGENLEEVRATAAAIAQKSSAPVVPVLTKWDLNNAPDDASDAAPGAASTNARERAPDGSDVDEPVRVSAVQRSGLDELLERIEHTCLDQVAPSVGDDLVVTRERQRLGLEQAREELGAFRRAWQDDQLPATIAAVHLQAAVDALDAVIGVVTVDDVLDRVFRDFCIGK